MQRINNSEQNSQTTDKNTSSIKNCQAAPLGTGGMSAEESDSLRAGNQHSTGSRAHTLCTAAAQREDERSPSEVTQQPTFYCLSVLPLPAWGELFDTAQVPLETPGDHELMTYSPWTTIGWQQSFTSTALAALETAALKGKASDPNTSPPQLEQLMLRNTCTILYFFKCLFFKCLMP